MGLVPHSPDRDDQDFPLLEALRLRGPADVVEWASRDSSIGAMSWPEVHHLDSHGAIRCGFRAFSRDSIRRWAEDPSDLHRSRREGLAAGPCPPDWLIIESRQRWMTSGVLVTEADAQAFEVVHHELAVIGVRLLDVMIFDDEAHWWSMGQLLSGGYVDEPALTWPTPVLRPPARGRASSRTRRRPPTR